MRVRKTSALCISILALFLGPTVCVSYTASGMPEPSAACGSHYRNATTKAALDGKTAVALRIQEERKKSEVSWVVSDFEKCLDGVDASVCHRNLSNSVEWWSNGMCVNSYRELIESRADVNTAVAHKPKLRNQVVDIADREAHVTLDNLPDHEHHTYLLENVRGKWVVACFASSPAK